MQTMTPPATPSIEPPIVGPDLVDSTFDFGPESTPYRWSADTFLAMVDANIFPGEARVFLWDGEIYEKMAKTQAHVTSANKAFLAIVRALPEGWFPGAENPVKVGENKVPLPDLIVLRGVPDDYRVRCAEAADVGLIVEVSVTSLQADTGPKLHGYARAGIATYWVVDPTGGSVRAFADPAPDEGIYRSVSVHPRGDSIPLALGHAAPFHIAVDDILPRLED